MKLFLTIAIALTLAPTTFADTKMNISTDEKEAHLLLNNNETADGSFLYDLLKVPEVVVEKGQLSKSLVSAEKEMIIFCLRNPNKVANTFCDVSFYGGNRFVTIVREERFVQANFIGQEYEPLKDAIPDSDSVMYSSPDHRFTIFKNVGISEKEISFGWQAVPIP